jgi:hypothetical protein
LRPSPASSRDSIAASASRVDRDASQDSSTGRCVRVGGGVHVRGEDRRDLRRGVPRFEEQEVDAAVEQRAQRRAVRRAASSLEAWWSAGPMAPATNRGRSGVRRDHSSAASRASRAAAAQSRAAWCACSCDAARKRVGAHDVGAGVEVGGMQPAHAIGLRNRQVIASAHRPRRGGHGVETRRHGAVEQQRPAAPARGSG